MTNRWSGLIDQWEPRLQKAFLDSIYNVRNAAQIDQIVKMLERGDDDGALRAIGLDPTQFRVFDKAITDAFEAGGNATAVALPVTRTAEGLKVLFQFNIRNPVAEAWLRNYSATLVKEVVADQVVMARNVLQAGLSVGANPKTTALDLVGRISKATGKREGGLIGLTSSQEEWVRNYAAELSSNNPTAALSRALRDKRFDATVLRAAKEGKALTSAQINTMVTAYKNRALRYRAETIARAETITALHTAQEQAMQQAIQSGAIKQSQVTYIWRTAHDKRVRHTHRTMDGQIKPMGQAFVTGSGAHLMYPGDPSGPAAEVINCRCFREPKVDFLAGIK